jgi:predicted GNAT family acetyltransferase
MPGACAIQRPQKPILLGDLSEKECHTLAEQTGDVHYPGVVGPDRTALWFAERAIELGRQFLEPFPQQIHSLESRPRYPGVRGHARRSLGRDASILADWMASFIREAVPHEEAPPREQVSAAAENGRHMLWIVDEEPVSTAAIVRWTRNAAVISMVYTPPALRGRGYAGSIAAATVEQGFAAGKTIACSTPTRETPSQIDATPRSASNPSAMPHTCLDRLHADRTRTVQYRHRLGSRSV